MRARVCLPVCSSVCYPRTRVAIIAARLDLDNFCRVRHLVERIVDMEKREGKEETNSENWN